MCGIYGMIVESGVDGSSTIRNTLHGLEKLQYRGYDSAGIAFQSPTETNVVHKVVGTVYDLKRLVPSSGAMCHVAISHTRWATNGKPSLTNAHPITTGDQANTFAVVHNGIITNASTLRAELEMLGLRLSTQTDTEVVPMLCSMVYRAHPSVSFHALIEEVCAMLEGSYAMLIVSTRYPGKLIACKHESPLHIGIGTDLNYIAVSSDIVPLASDSNTSIYTLPDGAIVEMDSCNLWEAIQRIQQSYKHITNPDMPHASATLGKYGSFLEKEILQQPQTLRASIQRFLDDQKQISFGGLDALALQKLHVARYVVLIGCGTSLHACIACKDLFRRHCSNNLVFVESASSFCEEDLPLSASDVCILVSQSGETADTIAAMHLAKRKGATCFAITNQPNSTIALSADYSIYLGIGEEVSVASTKAYTSQLCTMIMFIQSLSETPAIKGNDLFELPEALEACLVDLNDRIETLAKYVINFHHLLVVGCAADLATCMEGALKIKEVPYIHAEAILAGELKHGPLALIDDNVLVIVVATSIDANNGKIKLAIDQLKARDAHVIVISTEQNAMHTKRVVCVPKLRCHMLQRIVDIVPFQLLALHLARIKDIDIDRPRNLAKSVTVA